MKVSVKQIRQIILEELATEDEAVEINEFFGFGKKKRHDQNVTNPLFKDSDANQEDSSKQRYSKNVQNPLFKSDNPSFDEEDQTNIKRAGQNLERDAEAIQDKRRNTAQKIAAPLHDAIGQALRIAHVMGKDEVVQLLLQAKKKIA